MREGAHGPFSPLRLERSGKGYVLLEEFCYHHASGLIRVPAGFYTDLDSVPRLPLIYWLYKGASVRPPVIHDWLYFSQAGRAYADRVFLDAMADVGVSAWRRYPIHWGLRVGGWVRYNKYGTLA